LHLLVFGSRLGGTAGFCVGLFSFASSYTFLFKSGWLLFLSIQGVGCGFNFFSCEFLSRGSYPEPNPPLIFVVVLSFHCPWAIGSGCVRTFLTSRGVAKKVGPVFFRSSLPSFQSFFFSFFHPLLIFVQAVTFAFDCARNMF